MNLAVLGHRFNDGLEARQKINFGEREINFRIPIIRLNFFKKKEKKDPENWGVLADGEFVQHFECVDDDVAILWKADEYRLQLRENIDRQEKFADGLDYINRTLHQ